MHIKMLFCSCELCILCIMIHDTTGTNYTIFIICVMFIKYGYCWTLLAYPSISNFISALEITSMLCKHDVLFILFTYYEMDGPGFIICSKSSN